MAVIVIHRDGALTMCVLYCLQWMVAGNAVNGPGEDTKHAYLACGIWQVIATVFRVTFVPLGIIRTWEKEVTDYDTATYIAAGLCGLHITANVPLGFFCLRTTQERGRPGDRANIGTPSLCVCARVPYEAGHSLGALAHRSCTPLT